MKKVMLVFETRPEAIRMTPSVEEFQKKSANFRTIVYVTGQHREMLDQVLQIFDIKPNYDLSIMEQGRDLYDVTTRVLTGMCNMLNKAKPDVILTHGDTTTSTAAALTVFYQQIPADHIEAGLRTHNIYSPWPEEVNRQITERVTTYHFSPTALSKKNLLAEGVQEDKTTVTGNTVINALHIAANKIKTDGALRRELAGMLEKVGYNTSRLAGSKKFALIVGHRRENFGDGSISMRITAKDLTTKYPYMDFVYPMRLNPNARKPIHGVFGKNLNSLGNIFFIEPLEYLSFMFLMKEVTLVLTDSDGIQGEAPGLGRPVLMMRNTTERPEALNARTVELVGTDCNKTVSEVSILLDDISAYKQMSRTINPYGDGKACMCITQTLNVRL